MLDDLQVMSAHRRAAAHKSQKTAVIVVICQKRPAGSFQTGIDARDAVGEQFEQIRSRLSPRSEAKRLPLVVFSPGMAKHCTRPSPRPFTVCIVRCGRLAANASADAFAADLLQKQRSEVAMTRRSDGDPEAGQISRQHWSAQRYAETAHFVPTLGAPVLELLTPNPGEQILDLGCGDGVLTEKIAVSGATVVAVDAAADMVAATRRRGLDARVVAGQDLDFDQAFDAVFSNAALHWMRPPEKVLAGVYCALKPGGRFVAEMGGHNNTAAIIVALSAVLGRRGLDAHRLSPWYFPSAETYREKLEAAGFAVDDIRIVPRPTPLPAGLEAWLDTFAEDFFAPLSPGDRAAARGEVVALLRPVLMDERGTWIADYVRLRFRARRPG